MYLLLLLSRLLLLPLLASLFVHRLAQFVTLLPHPPSCFDPACHHLDHRVFKFVSTSSAQLYFLHLLAHARCRGQLMPHTCVPTSHQHILLVLRCEPMISSSSSSSSHLCTT